MLPRITLSGSDELWNKKQLEVQRVLLNFAKQGLRTLVVAQKILDPYEYERLKKDHDKLKLSNASNKEKKLNELYDKFE